jgi:hypothetical protein
MTLLLVFSEKNAAALGTVRALPAAQAARHEGRVWLRLVLEKKETPLSVKQLPAEQTYTLGAGGLLFPPGGSTPTGALPRLHWQKLSDFLPVELPPSALPAEVKDQVPGFRMAPSERAERSIGLLTDWPTWEQWADSAPEARLHRLRFAVSSRYQVLVVGDLLPPLPGREYWNRDLLLLPAGYDLQFPVLAALAEKQLVPDNDAIILLDTKGAWERVPAAQFMPALRSAVRRTGWYLNEVEKGGPLDLSED